MPAILEPLECPATDVASVPRRFGAGVLMILVTAFAVLFATMQTVHVGQRLFEIIAVLFLGVTLGQILLFQGKKPRAASLLVGSILFPLELLVVDYYVALGGIYVWGGRGMFYGRVAGTILGYVAAGAALGYLAGCVMASVFLVQEKLRRRAHPPAQIELQPFTAADFDTLISWVGQPQFLDLWSRGRFHFPLDHAQLAAHLDGFAGEPPNFLCFKAVCGEMQQMVAYVELANIDREQLRAGIDLAIVDPARDDRGHLSDVLVWEVMQRAFHQQGLQWLGVRLHRSATQSQECFRKHGFYDAHAARSGDEPDEHRELIRSSRY